MVADTDNYWTPKAIVLTLQHYMEIEATLASGWAGAVLDGEGSSIWTPGAAIEKLCCRKADIDLAVNLLKPPLRAAVTGWFFVGMGTYRGLGRHLRCDRETARKRLWRGVGNMAVHLCQSSAARSEAIYWLRELAHG
jgi:hypothetical protein